MVYPLATSPLAVAVSDLSSMGTNEPSQANPVCTVHIVGKGPSLESLGILSSEPSTSTLRALLPLLGLRLRSILRGLVLASRVHSRLGVSSYSLTASEECGLSRLRMQRRPSWTLACAERAGILDGSLRST